jgi:hypothetical protein
MRWELELELELKLKLTLEKVKRFTRGNGTVPILSLSIFSSNPSPLPAGVHALRGVPLEPRRNKGD